MRWVILLLLCGCMSSYVPVNEVDFVYNISNAGGFHLGTDPLHFGSGTYASQLKRSIFITNNFDSARTFKFQVEGGGQGGVFIYPNHKWSLQPNETQEFLITIMPGNGPIGQYNGTFKILQKRGVEKNVYQSMYVLDPFEIDSIFAVLNVLISCQENNVVTGQDMGFATYDYWRSILRC